MNRVPEVLLYVKNLIQSIQPWMMRVLDFQLTDTQKEFQAMRLSIVTIEGTELVSLLLKHTNNVLCQEETIDYQRVCTDNGGKIQLEASLRNSLLAITSSIPKVSLPGIHCYILL